MIEKYTLGSMHTNCYVVYNEDKECLLVDPGAQAQDLIQLLNQKQLKLKAILLTHGHFDHIGAVDALYEEFHCPVYAHEKTFPLLKDSRLNLSYFQEKFIISSPVLPCEDHMLLCGYDIEWFLLEGHCAGSCMIYIKEENALFSGDVLFQGSIGRYDFPTSSKQQTVESLRTMKQFTFDANLYPGHGGNSTLQYELENNPFFHS